MKIGEVCLQTNDVLSLATFYKNLLNIENHSDDPVHQTLISEETQLSIYNDGSAKPNNNRNICLSFTVDDIAEAHSRLVALGAEIIDPPARRPWGATNMSFYDPDGNVIYLRSYSL